MKITPFTKKVYRIVARIPIGEVRTYKWVAKKAGRPRAYRAVGQVLKNNPCPFIIPCHRVVKSNNSLGGYAYGGTAFKKKLLSLEKRLKECLTSRE